MALDYSDPCAVAAALREARVKLAMGERAVRVEIGSGNVTRSVQYQQATMADLDQAIRDAEARCAATETTTPRRAAIGTGYKPRW
jgi:gpW